QASMRVDDASVRFSLDGPRELGRLRSSTIVVPFHWVEGDPMTVGVTSSTGIETVHEIPAAVLPPPPSAKGFLASAIIGFLVGVLPIALGLLWLPSLRRADAKWLAAFMALTAGVLTFLGIEALAEAFELQAALPGMLGGPGLVLLGVALSFLTITFFAARTSRRRATVSGLALATLVAVGIGLHNLGEGLAVGTSFSLGELTLGTFLIVGFMIHNITEGLGIAAPLAEGGEEAKIPFPTLVGPGAIAGAPAILGAWIGGYSGSDVLAVLFFALAAGAAFQVVVEVGRSVTRRAPGGLTSWL